MKPTTLLVSSQMFTKMGHKLRWIQTLDQGQLIKILDTQYLVVKTIDKIKLVAANGNSTQYEYNLIGDEVKASDDESMWFLHGLAFSHFDENIKEGEFYICDDVPSFSPKPSFVKTPRRDFDRHNHSKRFAPMRGRNR